MSDDVGYNGRVTFVRLIVRGFACRGVLNYYEKEERGTGGGDCSRVIFPTSRRPSGVRRNAGLWEAVERRLVPGTVRRNVESSFPRRTNEARRTPAMDETKTINGLWGR